MIYSNLLCKLAIKVECHFDKYFRNNSSCSHVSIAGTYIPRKEVVVEETIRATVVRPNQAIKLRARKETVDRNGNARVTGEEWVVKRTGAYLPGGYKIYLFTDPHLVGNTYTYLLTPTWSVSAWWVTHILIYCPPPGVCETYWTYLGNILNVDPL